MSQTATARQHRIALALCIALSLLLVGGAIGSWVSQSLRQQRAVQRICAVSGSRDSSIAYEYSLDESSAGPVNNDSFGAAWLEDWFGIDFVAKARWAKVDNAAASALLADLPSLRAVVLDGAKITDEAMANIKPLTQLERLDLETAAITDEGLKVLPWLSHLVTLRLDDCGRITDAGFESIGKVSSLHRLYLLDLNVNGQGLSKLDQLKKLEILNIDLGPRMTVDFIDQLAMLPALRRLELGHRWPFNCGKWKHLDRLKGLEELSLSGIPALAEEIVAEFPVVPELKCLEIGPNDTGRLTYLEKFPGLERLTLWGAKTLDDEATTRLANLPKLRELAIDSFRGSMTDEQLSAIARLKGLRKLRLYDWPGMSDATLPRLADARDLEQLIIEDDDLSRLSPAAISDLKRRLPGCRIEYRVPPTEIAEF